MCRCFSWRKNYGEKQTAFMISIISSFVFSARTNTAANMKNVANASRKSHIPERTHEIEIFDNNSVPSIPKFINFRTTNLKKKIGRKYLRRVAVPLLPLVDAVAVATYEMKNIRDKHSIESNLYSNEMRWSIKCFREPVKTFSIFKILNSMRDLLSGVEFGFCLYTRMKPMQRKPLWDLSQACKIINNLWTLKATTVQYVNWTKWNGKMADAAPFSYIYLE